MAQRSRSWPKVPWKMTGLLDDGIVWFIEYGRQLPSNPETRLQANEDAGRVSQALTQTFYPAIQAHDSWSINRGVASFWIGLNPQSQATRAEILDLFHWLLALMRRFSNALKEISRAVLHDAHGTSKAYFSLTFPGIDGGPQGRSEE
ncbi:MAG: hypothetical protein Q9166_008194 [cf. Caloplaca sp. 2 TL-2023]